MANKKRGEVELELDGAKHTLRFNYNSLCEIEQLCGGQPLDYLLTSEGKGMSRTFIRQALYCGLVSLPRSQKTPKKIGDMISRTLDDDPGSFIRIVSALLTSIMYANGASDEDIRAMNRSLDSTENDEDMEDSESIEVLEVPSSVPLSAPNLQSDMTGTS